MYRLFLALLLAAPAVAQQADTVAVEVALPEVSVVATRLATPPSAAPARVTVLGRAEVEAAGSRSVADLLEARSAAFVRRYGPAGLASISLRGTGAAQTLVLLDGHRIADPQLGQLDLSLLPTILLERVEIMHGAASALHGTDGMGGVVDLRTVSAHGRSTQVATTVGAYGERSATGRLSVGSHTLRGVFAAEGATSQGDFPYFDPNLGTDGAVTRRTGAEAHLASFFGRIDADLGRTTAHAAVWGGNAIRGIPGSIGAPVEARQRDRHLRVWGGAATRYGWGTLRAGALVQRASLRFGADEGQTALASAEVEARLLIGRWVISSGATAGFAEAEHPGLDRGAREMRAGAFVSAIGEFGGLLLYPALRADTYLRDDAGADNLTALSPRIGANWRPIDALPLRLKAGLGSAFRAPTFNDRFWRYADGGVAGGDPDLRPERGRTADVGAFAEAGPFRAEVTAYGAWLRDQIVWRPAHGGLFAPVNIGRTRTIGLEATLETARARDGRSDWSAGLTYALTDARDLSEPAASSYNRQLRYVPRHQIKGHAGVAIDLAPLSTLRLDLDARYVARRPVRVDGTLDQPAYLVADGRATVSHRIQAYTISLSLAVENILGHDYAIIRGYPMPPRHGRLRLHLAF